MRLRPLLLAVATLAILAIGSQTAQAAGPTFRGIGIGSLTEHTTFASVDADLDAAHRLGANSVRTSVSWAALETAPGVRDPAYVALLDHVMAGARARGLKVLATILDTPCWTSTDPDRGDCSTVAQRETAIRWPPTDNGAFAAAAAFVAGRHAADLAGIEIWNEPDQVNELYWAGPDKVARYAALLKTAYPAIKAAAPTVPVIGAAIVGSNGAFLEALYARGIQGSYDGLGVHYYDLVLTSLQAIRKVQLRHGDRTPLWMAEFGWTSCARGTATRREGPHVCVTPARQAANTLDVFGALARPKGSYVRAALVYTLRDSSTLSFGAYDRLGRAKPIVSALRRAFAGRPGSVRAIRLSLRRSRGQVIASGSGPGADAFQIDVRQAGRLRYRAAFRLDRNGRFRLALPAALGTRGLSVKVFQYWHGGGVTRRI